MFEFIYKMFGEGYAALPKAGIEAIPKQLLKKLKNTKIHYNTTVASVKEKEIVLTSGKVLKTDYTIIATDASNLVEKLSKSTVTWKSAIPYTSKLNIEK